MSQTGSFNIGGVLSGISQVNTDSLGPVLPNALGQIDIVGFGSQPVSTIGDPLNHKIGISVLSGAITWNRINGAGPIQLGSDKGYVSTNALLTTFVLPEISLEGQIIWILGEGIGLFRIEQNAGQNIQWGNVSTTPGVGSWSSSGQYDSIQLICRVANTTWSAVSVVGTPVIV